MIIRFYQTECGDAASIRYIGNDEEPHCIFLDAGYERTYRNILADEITAINESGNQIDLWIISHFHDDHIGGIIPYVKAITAKENDDIVSQWWYNLLYSPVTFNDKKYGISEAVSFDQSVRLTSYFIQTGKLNPVDIVAGLPSFNVFGLVVTVLSPSVDLLGHLREKYKDKALQALDYHTVTEISEPKSGRQSDYFKPIDSFDLNNFKEDNAIENGSSIAVITELNGKKILWLADAFPHVICESLRNLGFSEANPIKVDLVKVAHHGSKGNNSSELFSLIRCEKYLFSANGENNNNLPAKECLACILRNNNRPLGSFYEFLFTYDNSTLRELFKVDGKNVYTRWNFKTTFAANDKWVEVLL
jgi:hypothetical protein